jgi:signal transduction histidine kinase
VNTADTQVSPSLEPERRNLKGLLRWVFGLQGKLILPYVILTLILAAFGAYFINGLVAADQRERFVNQLNQAAGVAVDNVARRENFHITRLREMVNIVTIGEIFRNREAERIQELIFPIAAGNQLEVISAVDADGFEIFSWLYMPETKQYQVSEQHDLLGFQPLKDVLAGKTDSQGDKFTGLMDTSLGPVIFTAAPVKDVDERLVGAIMVGTRLDTFLRETKSQALADIVALDQNRNFLATTLVIEKNEDRLQLQPDDRAVFEAAVAVADPKKVLPIRVEFYGDQYEMIFARWLMRKENAGWIGVILPSQFLTTSETTNRNLYAVGIALGTMCIVLVGYDLSRRISRPILKLRSISQSVAAGNLEQKSDIRRADEIGELASAFDVMTQHLRDRTAETARLYAEAVQRNQELAEINARLQATQLQLIQSEKLAAVGQLTAGIVHDVKNPLAVIKGLAELLQDDTGMSDETRRELKVIKESAEKANRIVSDLLKFSRQTTSELRPQDLRETVEAALRLTTYLIREARVQLVSDIPAQALLVAYDAQQIEQVLINLIHNAIQAMPNRGTLQVKLYGLDGKAVISVADSGVGIPPENLKRIFDPFFTTKPEGQGTGLGLSVSYGIIANHQGQIEVQSEMGKGTTFTIWLPMAQKPGEY